MVFTWRPNRSAEPIAAPSKTTHKRTSNFLHREPSNCGLSYCSCSLWFQLSDCFRGVVFDSVETLFARNTTTALLCLLKAIGSREHIYVINMAQDYTLMKAQEKAKKDQEGKAPYPPALPFPSPNSPFNRALRFLKCFSTTISHCANETITSATSSVLTSALQGDQKFLFLLCTWGNWTVGDLLWDYQTRNEPSQPFL